MQVPRSAIGRSGICPSCGRTIAITADNTNSVPQRQLSKIFSARQFWGKNEPEPSEDAKRRFGQAVDLFYSQRYAEALAVFDSLVRQFPGNSEIANARQQCMAAIKRPPTPPALENKSKSMNADDLSESTVKRVVLEKLLYGASENVQLQAAELACRLLGLGSANESTQGLNSENGRKQSPRSEAISSDTASSAARDAADAAGDNGNREDEEDSRSSFARVIPSGLYDIKTH